MAWPELAFLLVLCRVFLTEVKSTYGTEKKGTQLSYTAWCMCHSRRHLRVPKACCLQTSDTCLFVRKYRHAIGNKTEIIYNPIRWKNPCQRAGVSPASSFCTHRFTYLQSSWHSHSIL